MRPLKSTLWLCILLFGWLLPARAETVTYEYLGKPFNISGTYYTLTHSLGITEFGTNIIGSVTFSKPIPAGNVTLGKYYYDENYDQFFPDGITVDPHENMREGFLLELRAGSFVYNSLTPDDFSDPFNTHFSHYRFNFTDGNLINWDIFVYDTKGDSFNGYDTTLITTPLSDYVDRDTNLSTGTYAYATQGGGAWTLKGAPVGTVPVPAALPLMATALGAVGFARRRKH